MTTTLPPPTQPAPRQDTRPLDPPHRPPGQRGGRRPNYTARRLVALSLVVVLLAAAWFAVAALVGLAGRLVDDAPDRAASPTGGVTRAAAGSGTAARPAGSSAAPGDLAPKVASVRPSATPAQGAAAPSDRTTLVEKVRLTSDAMRPKSIVAGPGGLLFAQNMMYRHSVSVFRADGTAVATIPDSVDLSAFGISGHPGTSQGAPVEVAFTPDGKYAWVSNYSMYGKGFGPEGLDSCTSGDGTDSSYVYRIDVAKLAVDKVVPVGAVPKYVAVTPDGKRVLVTNWCSWNLSVIDAATAKPTGQIALGGRYPRGIVVSPDSTTAYVAMMGSNKVLAVDLATSAVRDFASPGSGPRHLVISPDGTYVYVTNNSSRTVVKLDRATGREVASVTVGSEPRSMAISTDGLALYVVNYGSGSMTKIATGSMRSLQSVPTDAAPIGITYEPSTKSVWVACYGGSLIVFDDARLKA